MDGSPKRHKLVQGCLVVLALLLIPVVGPASAVAGQTGLRPCTIDEDDEPSAEENLGTFVPLGDGCLKLSGSVQATAQTTDISGPSFLAPQGTQEQLTLNSGVRVETSTPTQHGPLKTAFEVDWSAETVNGLEPVPNLDELTLSYAGFQAGYASSLMNFWSGDFEASASAPSLSTYLLSKEFALDDELKLAFAVEAGPPAAKGANSWEFPKTQPYYSSRLTFEHDDWTFHLLGIVHEAEVSATPAIAGSAQYLAGWAVSAGLTMPVTFTGENDEASMQLVYANNAPAFLGTTSDRSALAGLVPSEAALPTRGWSAVASFHHAWNDELSSNIFVSRAFMQLDSSLAEPTIHLDRMGGNLIYQINRHWKTGAEVGLVNGQINVNGTSGVFSGASFSGETGYLWAAWEF